MLLIIIPFSISNVVQGEGTEPHVNFYVERELFGHSDDVSVLAWSANGQSIASGSLDNTTRIWSTGTWSTVKTFHHSAPVFGISWSKTTLKLAISYGNGTVEVYNSVGWALLKTLTDHLDTISGLSFSPDGSMLSTGDDLGHIEIWDATTWISLKTLDLGSGVKELQWSNSQDKLAACSNNGTITIWETATWTTEQSFDTTSGDQSVESISWSPDDSKLASSSGEMEVIIWDTEFWNALHTLDSESNPNEIIWSYDDTYVVVSVIGGVKIWNATNWEVIQSQELNENSQVEALSASPEGNHIASSGPYDTNNTVIIWEKNLSPVLDPIGSREAIEDQPFSLIVSASDDDQLAFTDDSPLFVIDASSAQISFTPTNDDVGEHSVTITVNDGKGGVDNETFIFTVVNVDDPPVPSLKWRYGADYVNITLRVGGEVGNSVSLIIEEEDMILDEITLEKESEYYDEKRYHLDMNLTKSYEVKLNYSGASGKNPVAVTFEHNGFAYTNHMSFDSENGEKQTEEMQISDLFKEMGLIIFDASSSFDVDNIIMNYLWDFGDGYVGDGQEAVHIYHENGIYNVSLTVESENGINALMSTEVIQDKIPDKDVLKSELEDESTLEYLETINYNAVFLDKKEQLRIVDSTGNTVDFVDGSYLSEIEDVQLAYSLNSGVIYYLPNNQELTFDILDSDEPYELHLLIPHTDIDKVINIYGDSGGDTVELNEENDVLTFYTTDFEKNYSLRFEADDDPGKDLFLLSAIKIRSEDTHYFFINNWEGLTSDTKAVTLGIDEDGDGEIDVSIDLENGMTGEEIEIIILSKGESDSSFFTTINLILIVGFVGIAGLGGFIWATEIGKLALLSLILPLYTRIKKEKVLDNEIRGMIRGYVIANPGDNYNSIKRALGLNNGVLAHHLKVLERAEIIKSRQDGMFKRFYPASMRIPAENGGEISEIQNVLLHKIVESPGISQKEIATLLGLSKGVINYHVKVLLAKQMLKMEKRGRKTYCYVNKKALHIIKNTSKDKNEVKQ
jgi:WD40 repeat protein/DNA-binding transcriptional ArsR family regulator